MNGLKFLTVGFIIMKTLNSEAADKIYAPEMYAGSIISKLRKGECIEDWEIKDFSISLETVKKKTEKPSLVFLDLYAVIQSIDESKEHILNFINGSQEKKRINITNFFDSLKEKTREMNPLIVKEISDTIEYMYYSSN